VSIQCYCIGVVVKSPTVRTRRAERAEETRRRIVAAATGLFAELGYSATTMETIADEADVAVETVYSRFRNKARLLDAVLGPAIVGDDDPRPLEERPEMAAIRALSDQTAQVRAMAHLSRTILERAAQVHLILETAAACDEKAAQLHRADRRRRRQGQAAYIDMLMGNGALREGLTAEDAADTYASLANPSTYRLLTVDRGWTPLRFEHWLADCLCRLLLPG
jgi:AcrR family transcriptional regulator